MHSTTVTNNCIKKHQGRIKIKNIKQNAQKMNKNTEIKCVKVVLTNLFCCV